MGGISLPVVVRLPVSIGGKPDVTQQGSSNASNVRSAPGSMPAKVDGQSSASDMKQAIASLNLGAAIERGHPAGCGCPICSGNRSISFGGPGSSGFSTSVKSRALASTSGSVTNASTGDKMQAVKTPISVSIASVQTAAKASAAQEAALASNRAAEASLDQSAEKTAIAVKNNNSAPVMGRNVKISVNLSSTAAVAQSTQTTSAQTTSRAGISNQTMAVAARNAPVNAASNQNVQAQNIFSRPMSVNTPAANIAGVQQNAVNVVHAPTASTPTTAPVTVSADASNISISTTATSTASVASARTVSVSIGASASSSSSAANNIVASVNSFNSAATGGMSARILNLFSESKGFSPVQTQNNAVSTVNLQAGEKAVMQKPVPINLAFVPASLAGTTTVLTGVNGAQLVINGQQMINFGIAPKEAGANGVVFGGMAPRETKATSQQPIISFAELSRIAHDRDVQKENLSKLINMLFGKIMHKEEDDEDLEGMYGIWRDYLERQREQKDQREKEERRKKKQKRDAELQEQELEAVAVV
ncbi:MAG: hypothetical protein LBK68_00445 [Candidatus Margulisbacteria bacterium]|jgi:hypothetical protein|nr:hypothetical protein [Candidatus Margulisiibacteriota bacterium]